MLLHSGELYLKNLKKAKLDINDLLMQCRVNGYFDLSRIETVILEGNGKLSILPKSTDRPAIPADFGLTPGQEDVVLATCSMDGQLTVFLKENKKEAADVLS